MFSLSASSIPNEKTRFSKRKCAFDIDSLLKPTINSSYTDDTSSEDGNVHSSFSNSPLSFYNQLKTNENLSFESEHSNTKKKSKRIRTIFTMEQLVKLESEFEKQQYMVGNERIYLAKQLDLSEAQVKIWFQNRRIKWRRQTLDNHQQ